MHISATHVRMARLVVYAHAVRASLGAGQLNAWGIWLLKHMSCLNHSDFPGMRLLDDGISLPRSFFSQKHKEEENESLVNLPYARASTWISAVSQRRAVH